MKPDTIKALTALHAQVSAVVLQIESILDVEENEQCQHEDITDMSTMGQPPRTRYHCNDCNQDFGG